MFSFSLRGAPTGLNFALDGCSPDAIVGWAFSAIGLKEVQARVNGVIVGRSELTHDRPDVRAAFPGDKHSLRSGFAIPLDRRSLGGPACSVVLEFLHSDGRSESGPTVMLYVPGPPSSAVSDLPRAPFAASVLRVLTDLRGQSYYASGDWSEARIEEAIADLTFVVRHGPKTVPGLYHYLGWLRETWERFQFNDRHFPRHNPLSTTGREKDFTGVASSTMELLAIANHVYVLRSRGLAGPFLEFGCFKGFSTACLSQACRPLGIRMQVFDSFAGLPPSDSVYHLPGDFAGSYEEVTRNVGEFGASEVVDFHRGFFSETLPGRVLTPIAIWMDVDLSSSSRDVMSILDQLPAQSAVLTHECWPDHFLEGAIVAGHGPDAVIPPILEAFARIGRTPAGRFIGGHTGAFWDRATGIPVLPAEAVLRIKDLA